MAADGAAAPHPPLSVTELAASLARIGGFEPHPRIAVATSGGPDSLALAILADRWAREHGGEARAVTVDHRLRPESGAEARQVAAWLAARHIRHDVLVWRGDKPATGIQEAARAARYRLLAEWCRERGILHLLTAHHREDQAETYWIRRRAGSGPDGLAGMAAVRELAGVRLVRPLLDAPRARLAAALAAEGQAFLSDPSNSNPVFERVRIRLGLGLPAGDAAGAAPSPRPSTAGGGEGSYAKAFSPQTGDPALPSPPPAREGRGEGVGRADPVQTVLGEMRGHAGARMMREAALADLLGRTVALHPAGFALVELAPLLAAGALGEQALGRVAQAVGGAEYPLRRERVVRLCAGLAAAPDRRRTLGGCCVVPWRGRALVMREPGRTAPPTRLAPGASAVWDRRFAVALPAGAAGPVTVGCLGNARPRELLPAAELANSLPRLLRPALPAVWDEAGLLAVPHLFHRRPGAGILPSLAYRPAVPLFNAGFTVV